MSVKTITNPKILTRKKKGFPEKIAKRTNRRQEKMIENLGAFEYHPDQRERFKSGELIQNWAEKYPNIFDEKDVRTALNQAKQYHFYEWLAAVLIFQSFGYLSLVESYQFKGHTRKLSVLQKYLKPEVYDLVTDHAKLFGNIQCPDLFVYSPHNTDWFFCEVKGPHDRLRKSQLEFFNVLGESSQKVIRVIHFKPANFS